MKVIKCCLLYLKMVQGGVGGGWQRSQIISTFFKKFLADICLFAGGGGTGYPCFWFLVTSPQGLVHSFFFVEANEIHIPWNPHLGLHLPNSPIIFTYVSCTCHPLRQPQNANGWVPRKLVVLFERNFLHYKSFLQNNIFIIQYIRSIHSSGNYRDNWTNHRNIYNFWRLQFSSFPVC